METGCKVSEMCRNSENVKTLTMTHLGVFHHLLDINCHGGPVYTKFEVPILQIGMGPKI